MSKTALKDCVRSDDCTCLVCKIEAAIMGTLIDAGVVVIDDDGNMRMEDDGDLFAALGVTLTQILACYAPEITERFAGVLVRTAAERRAELAGAPQGATPRTH